MKQINFPRWHIAKSCKRRQTEQNAARIDWAVKEAVYKLGSTPSLAFLQLLAHLRARTSLLKFAGRYSQAGSVAPVFLIRRLRNLADQHNHWIRHCETWQPNTCSVREAFRSLAHHLFAHYSVPAFMDSVWDLPACDETLKQQWWYIHLGRGVSFRKLRLPLVLTRAMEHHVRQAPDHFSALQALRYGEILGLGGTVELAKCIVRTRLGQTFEHWPFWRTVLAFLITQAKSSLEDVEPIIDFIQAYKFTREEVHTGNGVQDENAPCPDFSIKGRTLKSILRLVSAWQADCAVTHRANRLVWKKSSIEGYRFFEERPKPDFDRHWRIMELLDSGALLAEGRTMRHCVYSYVDRCRFGYTTIWSLRLRVNGQEKRLATIEVDPANRSIVQVRSKCNSQPGGRTFEIIQKWANQAGLQIATI